MFDSGWGRLKHSLSGILAILDLGISAIPFRLIHVIYPILAGILYSMFSYFFWLGDLIGPMAIGQVYPGLNWAHPRTAILACLCVLLVSFLVHVSQSTMSDLIMCNIRMQNTPPRTNSSE
ncbi:hypothetical protein AHF37_04921 [Paragonimus kellicotti]|nr:hypothetical protein AHF37_04921 [Paragonimus kellicotti]